MSVEENKKLVEKYPFLIPRNVCTGEIVKDYDYSYIEGFNYGWKDIFLEYCENILPWYNSLDEESKKQFYFTELKEKYGQMRIYTSFTSEEERKANDIVLNKSKWTCYNCGKKPRDSKHNHVIWTNRGYIIHLCKECALKSCDYDKKKLKKWFSRKTHDKKFYIKSYEDGKWIKNLIMEW